MPETWVNHSQAAVGNPLDISIYKGSRPEEISPAAINVLVTASNESSVNVERGR
jgi:hypothetical protein